jgi:hypothetical protein
MTYISTILDGYEDFSINLGIVKQAYKLKLASSEKG